MKRKWLAFLMVCILIMSNTLVLAQAEEPVKLTGVFVKHALTRELDTMQWLTDAEAAAGVEIEWQEITSGWEDVKAAIMASGDIPDVLVNATLDADYTTFDGLFENLAPHIDSGKMPNLAAFYEAHPESRVLAEMADGAIYGTTSYQRFWPDVATSWIINKTWLDNLGLEVPTNWDELKNVLIAFRDNDANGNGDPNDEFPMDFYYDLGQYNALMLLGGTGIQLVNFLQDGFFAEGGQVKSIWNDPRYKEWVVFMNSLWQEGLIDPDVWTNDYSTYQSIARGDGEYAKVGFTWGWEISGRVGTTLAQQYVSIAPLAVSADDARDVRCEYDYIALNHYKNRASVSALSDNIDAAVRFVDELYKPETGIQILWGDLGKGVEKRAENVYTILPPAEDMDPSSWKWTITWADRGTAYISDEFDVTLGSDMQNIVTERAVYNDYVAKIDQENYSDLFVEMYMKYSADDQNTLAVDWANVKNYVLPTMTAWITGTQDVNAEWDNYVAQLENLGLGEMLSIKQTAFDTWLQSK